MLPFKPTIRIGDALLPVCGKRICISCLERRAFPVNVLFLQQLMEWGSMSAQLTQTDRTTISRHSERASYDRDIAYAIIDEGMALSR
jgi:hypothetical protein